MIRKGYWIKSIALAGVCWFAASSLHGAIPASERAALISLYRSTSGDSWSTGWKTPPLAADGFALPGTEGGWSGVTVTADRVTRLELVALGLAGSLPEVLGNLAALTVLDLSFNPDIVGEIPATLGNLTSLESLDLEHCNLTGHVPGTLGNLTRLEILDLASNQLTGALPARLGDLAHLTTLSLYSNSFTGIPAELGNLANLTELDLRSNQLGRIPAELGNLTRLTRLDLNTNTSLSGTIPAALGNLAQLQYLDLSNTRLSGSIPAELGNLAGLVELNLGHNQLSGTIPAELGSLTHLQRLTIGWNQVSGSIPAALGNLTSLRQLSLARCQLSGNIPAALGELESLTYLAISETQISGTIPVELGGLPELTSLILSSNRLSGSIPAWLGSMTHLQRLFLDGNQFSGSIPAALGNMVDLESLGLSSNQLSGSIPAALGNLIKLRDLNLLGNRLSGSIPTTLTALTDASFNLHCNALYSGDSALVAFLNAHAGTWAATQTVAPTGLSATVLPSAIRLSWTPISYTDDAGGYRVYVATTSGGPWTLFTTTADKSATSVEVDGLTSMTRYYFVIETVTAPHHSYQPNTVVSERTAEVSGATGAIPPGIGLNRARFDFRECDSVVTPAQTLLIRNTGGGTLAWTATASQSWIELDRYNGTGNGALQVAVNPVGLRDGTHSGSIVIADPNAANSPVTVPVTLVVQEEGSAPFGQFETPASGTTGLAGNVAVTGWALDDVGVTTVKIYRDPVAGEGTGKVYIGDASLVEGARPDVEALYPAHPFSYRAGWGYMLLTNFLPGGGNGTYRIYAYAADREGHSVSLGTKTIACDNANATLPFGTLDTPGQGGGASGSSFVNFGWALTPGAAEIPIDGSTITVWVDGAPLGHPTYNQYREDIATLFPGYANSDGAVGYYYLDPSSLTEGVHTIAWSVRDSLGREDGIGSRYFSVSHGESPYRLSNPINREDSSLGKPPTQWAVEHGESFDLIGMDGVGAGLKPAPTIGDDAKNNNDSAIDTPRPLRVRRGFSDIEETPTPDRDGVLHVAGRIGEPLSICLDPDLDGSNLFTGGERVGTDLRPLPVGSRLDPDTGIFTWLPGPGFRGVFSLEFTAGDDQHAALCQRVVVRIE